MFTATRTPVSGRGILTPERPIGKCQFVRNSPRQDRGRHQPDADAHWQLFHVKQCGLGRTAMFHVKQCERSLQQFAAIVSRETLRVSRTAMFHVKQSVQRVGVARDATRLRWARSSGPATESIRAD